MTESYSPRVVYIGEVVSVEEDFLVLNEYGVRVYCSLILRTLEVTRTDADDKCQKQFSICTRNQTSFGHKGRNIDFLKTKRSYFWLARDRFAATSTPPLSEIRKCFSCGFLEYFSYLAIRTRSIADSGNSEFCKLCQRRGIG